MNQILLQSLLYVHCGTFELKFQIKELIKEMKQQETDYKITIENLREENKSFFKLQSSNFVSTNSA